MSRVRPLSQIPAASSVSLADETVVWQNGRTRVANLAQVVSTPITTAVDTGIAAAFVGAPSSLKANLSGSVGPIVDVALATLALAGNPIGDAIAAKAPLNFTSSAPGASALTLAQKLDLQPVSPADFKTKYAPGTSGIDHTQAVQAAINAGVSQYPRAVDLSGSWNVSKVTASGGNGLLLTGMSVLVGISTTSQSAILEITMGGVEQHGQIKAVGKYNNIYDRGVWIYSGSIGTAQYSVYHGLFANAVNIGLEAGNAAFPSGLTSEITIFGGGTYGCPTAMKVTGTETYVSVLGGTWSGDSFGGDATWQAKAKRACVNVGAHLSVGQGEYLITSDFNGYVFEKQPLAGISGEGTMWGTLNVCNAFVETAAPLLITTNPAGLTINATAGNRGVVQFYQCRGFHSQDREAFLTFSADYDGVVRVFGSRWWKTGAARTQPDIFCAGGGPKVDIYVDDMGFGEGFKNNLNGIIGGILHFTQRQILRVLTLTGQAVPANQSGGTPLLFQAVDQTGENARFSAIYNPATGTVTFSQAHEDVWIKPFVSVPAAAGTLYLKYNGALGQARPFLAGIGDTVWHLKHVNKNDTVQVVLGATNSGTGDSSLFTSEMVITARGAPN